MQSLSISLRPKLRIESASVISSHNKSPQASIRAESISSVSSISAGQQPYLCLDTVQAAEPEDLSTSQLPLSVVNLLLVLIELLLRHLVLLGEPACTSQEPQLAVGNGGDHLVQQEEGS